MEKVKVKLSEKLDQEESGFYDISIGKKIAPKNYKKGEAFEVELTSFIESKIDSRELILVEDVKEDVKESTKK